MSARRRTLLSQVRRMKIGTRAKFVKLVPLTGFFTFWIRIYTAKASKCCTSITIDMLAISILTYFSPSIQLSSVY